MEKVLSRNEVLSYDQEETKITCIMGRCYITQEGDPQDYFLDPEDTFFSTRGKKIVIGALDQTCIRVENEIEEKQEKTTPMKYNSSVRFKGRVQKMEYICKKYKSTHKLKKEKTEALCH